MTVDWSPALELQFRGRSFVTHQQVHLIMPPLKLLVTMLHVAGHSLTSISHRPYWHHPPTQFKLLSILAYFSCSNILLMCLPFCNLASLQCFGPHYSKKDLPKPKILCHVISLLKTLLQSPISYRQTANSSRVIQGPHSWTPFTFSVLSHTLSGLHFMLHSLLTYLGIWLEAVPAGKLTSLGHIRNIRLTNLALQFHV